MPWQVCDVIEERSRFIADWHSGLWTMAELCREYGLTRKIGYKWVSRYEAEGPAGLADRRREPHAHPNAIGEERERAIVELRALHPSWGARKLQKLLEWRQPQTAPPAASTIGAVLQRHGLTVERKRRHRAPARSAPLAHADGPNRVWCGDFKGWFRTGDGQRCDPLTITDAYSRYLLRCQALPQANGMYAKAVFEAAFREYGLPQIIRTDNGAPFASPSDSGLTALAVWWIRLGIVPERIRPGRPQENGRHERMHRTLKQATASPPAGNRRQQQARFDAFRQEYNQERPHEALGQTPPGEHYEPSQRWYCERWAPLEYPADWQVRRVSPGGQIRWKNACLFVSHALEDEAVGLEPIDDRYWRVHFSFYPLGVLDAATKKLWTCQQWDRRMRGLANG
jgi:transposase InsO family protein